MVANIEFPIGYFKFHKNKFLNYQLNRWYSLGFARKEDIIRVGKGGKNFQKQCSTFTTLMEEAIADNRLKNAACYSRAAEFLMEKDDPAKINMYNKFIDLFDKAFSDEDIERYRIPYNSGFLSAMRLLPKIDVKKGTIIGIIGFDSCIEEFYAIWNFFAENGYEVVAFEGPGQGASLRLSGLPFDHDWEKPTSTILNFFHISNAIVVGISMGGYWCLRAAAYEKRITHVIVFPPVYDWMEMASSFSKKLVQILLNHRKVMNRLIKLKTIVGTLKHTINHALFILQKNEPIFAVEWLLGMNKQHLHSELVTQDVLLIGGENDAFQPPILLYKQQEALINARSVTSHIFTKSESADQHCQMGNLGLALREIGIWLDSIRK